MITVCESGENYLTHVPFEWSVLFTLWLRHAQIGRISLLACYVDGVCVCVCKSEKQVQARVPSRLYCNENEKSNSILRSTAAAAVFGYVAVT